MKEGKPCHVGDDNKPRKIEMTEKDHKNRRYQRLRYMY